MGKKLDALLGRKVKTSKFKTLANLAVSRIAILKKHHHVRCSHARSDVLQLLNLGQQERALLRVEHVIKDQNMLDVFVMIENYCCLLIDMDMLIQNNRECPDELKEAISSLIFASSRCSEFPELQQIREIFTTKFGKAFAAHAVELRNNCGVNLKMIQKLSMRQASLESRLQVLKQIASDNGITLHLEDDPFAITEDKQDVNQKKQQVEPKEAANLDHPELAVDFQHLADEPTRDEEFSESVKKAKKKYRDVAAAAQDAFESAAYAAAAARAAVELSRSESWDEDSDDHYGSNHRRRTVFSSDGSSKSKQQIDGDAASEDVEHSEKGLGFDKIYPVESFSSESEGEEMEENSSRSQLKELEQSKNKAGLERTSASSLGSDENDSIIRKMSSNLHDKNEPVGKEIIFDESDDETEENQDNIPWLKHRDSSSDKKSNLPINEFLKTRQYNAPTDEKHSDKKGRGLHSQSPKWIPLKSQADATTYSVEGRSRLANKHHLNAENTLYSQHSERDRKPASMRTRRVHRD